ncbi:MAG: ATPase, partial [Thermodesulfobacteriota bacterium]
MTTLDRFTKVSESPTRPQAAPGPRKFDVADLYRRGPAAAPAPTPEKETAPDLREKLRQTYFWITNHAIISPYYDIEYNDGPPQSYTFGDLKVPVNLPSDQSYSSYVLLPLLNLAVRRRCLLVGGPGRGKTAIAIL